MMGANRTNDGRIFNTVDMQRDRMRDALPAGKRFTDGGGVYYEYRTNRSDNDPLAY